MQRGGGSKRRVLGAGRRLGQRAARQAVGQQSKQKGDAWCVTEDESMRRLSLHRIQALEVLYGYCIGMPSAYIYGGVCCAGGLS